ncbi:acyltransferase [Sphingomonas sp. LY160]|uniref:acyltransferase family protein n=1 Tax=Sphingomonas sp. LY160 TaxID=3095342 RepID=UPI002ADEEF21|nr:acyltransferase [Sphingomonas sp. LY160]MEA1071022.1 acyltransferase [Sphingomonas sp. LY160]
MRSSSGQHFAGLDHIRALAAFLVVTWHFAHGAGGSPVPFNQATELAVLDEGHVGVSLFMTLSGYLFAKLIAGRSINYGAFLWNRALRLLPLLFVVLLIVGLRDYRDRPLTFFNFVVGGAVFPQLPNGGWSITSEAHFYIVLPLLLWVSAKWRWAPIGMVAMAVLARLVFLAPSGDVQELAYWTIIGRFDQFAFGIFFASLTVSGRWAASALVAIVAIYTAFDLAGGFYNGPDWPWIFMTTLEGATFGAIIAWYDAHPIRSPKMWLVKKAGDYSYAIYLLHFFFVFAAAAFIDQHIMRLDSLYVALPWALLFFVAMIGVGHMSYKLIEEPPMLRLRKRYIKETPQT